MQKILVIDMFKLYFFLLQEYIFLQIHLNYILDFYTR